MLFTQADYAVGLSRMMNGRFIASERPGHSILEGTSLSHPNNKGHKLTSWILSTESSKSTGRRRSPISIQFPRRCLRMESRPFSRSRKRHALETSTQHTVVLHRDYEVDCGCIGEEWDSGRCCGACDGWKGCRGRCCGERVRGYG